MNNVKDFDAIGDSGVVHFPQGTYLCGSLYLHSAPTWNWETQ